MKRKLFIVSIAIFAIIERFWFDLGPNIELITVASILTAFYLNKRSAVLITLFILIMSDLLIGNSNIFLFTWSGFLLPLLAINAFKKLKISNVLSGTLAGVSSNLFFFVWTNFGVWALDSWGMYPNTLSGLLMSYLNGLPFLKYQLTSTLFFVPLIFIVYEITFNSFPTFSKIKSALSKFAFV